MIKGQKKDKLLFDRRCETIGLLCNAIGSHPVYLDNEFASKVDARVLA